MIIILGVWTIILAFCLLLGSAMLDRMMPEAFCNVTRIDVYFVMGLMILNVYAQIWSVFGGVGKKAFIVITVTVLILLLCRLAQYKKRCAVITIKKIATWKICVTIAVSGYIMLLTIKSPEFVDTYLYHIQSIRWIEEYGVVPGLGNLHNRFAYNSAFLPLQALLSFSWIMESQHSLNGLLGCFFVIYAIVTNRIFTSEENMLSDYLKLVIVPYVFLNHGNISSPGTDMLAMLLVLYIVIKWSECIECHEKLQSYEVLCFIAIWAISVKISAVMNILLVIYPAVLLVKNKYWKSIVKDLVCGIVIILPWFVRNVIISGYLVYPYSKIDLFPVDWKMPRDLLDYDKKEITVYARGIQEVSRYGESITEWFGTWFRNQMPRNKILIVFGLAASIALLFIFVYIMIKGIRKNKITGYIRYEGNRTLLISVILAGEIFWLFAAPLVRYGMVYLMMPMALCYYFAEKRIGEKLNRYVIIIGTCMIVSAILYRSPNFRLVFPQGYWTMEGIANDLEGVTVYSAPDGGALSGYAYFPAVADKSVLTKIELRGKDISSGFRPKKKTT